MDRIKATASIAADEVRSIEWSSIKRNTILVAWMISGLVAFLAPLIQWTAEKRSFYKAQGYMIEYENQQREYEENQNNNNNEYQYGENQYSQYKECGWWNAKCQRQQMRYADYYFGENRGDQDNVQNYNQQIPGWFVFLSGGENEAMMRWKEENTGVRNEMDETSPTGGEIIAAIYMFAVLFIVFVIGCRTFYKSQPFSTLKWGLGFLINMVIVNFLLLPSLISNEDRMWDDSIYGFYGQIGVLMAYFDFWVMIFASVFLIVLAREEKKAAEEPVKIEEEDYKTMSA